MLAPILIWPQRITDDVPEPVNIRKRVNAMGSGTVVVGNFLYPGTERGGGEPYLNLFKKWNNLRLEPVWGMRWSSAGFEMDPENTPGPVLWISPGMKISYSTYVVDPMLNIWLYAWGRFHKHSAYGFNGRKVRADQTLFPYVPDDSMEYYNQSITPRNGIDFDETLGGIALITPGFDLVLGKFRNHLGPGFRGNLQLSRSTPGYGQIRVHARLTEKVHFTWLVGELSSEIPDSSLLDLYPPSEGLITKLPQVSRYLASHRLDYLVTDHWRLGLWEQVIFASRNIPMGYVNPFALYWSVQHEQGDVDNVQMGLDWEWTRKNIRVFGSFMMDEWALYDTFDAEKEHNWFAWQGGMSVVRPTPLGKMLVMLEYAWMDPRTYIHRFAVNDPEHHGYSLGYWSGGHSDDLYLGVYLLPDDKNTWSLFFSRMRQGDQDRQAIYLDEQREWTADRERRREEVGVRWIRTTGQNWQLEADIRYLNTDGLYPKDRFWDLTVKMLYNIYR